MNDVITLTSSHNSRNRTDHAADLPGVGYRRIRRTDLELVCDIEGTAADASVEIISGMQTEVEDGWLVVGGSFPRCRAPASR